MTNPSASYGVHSEVGKLRKVLVCSPGLAHERLTPTNCDELLFDDVLWVQNARRDHFDFMDKMRDRGVEVVELHNLLTETMAIPEAKAWLLDRKIVAERGRPRPGRRHPGVPRLAGAAPAGRAADRRACRHATCPPRSSPATSRWPARPTGVTEYLMPPLPNTLYTRDTTCWIYGGLTLNPLYWPARHDETLLMKAIYEFHPDYVGSTVWWGDPEQTWGLATIEGGDVMVARQRRGADRDERAHVAPGHHPGRGRAVRAGRGRARSSSPACPSCAPRCTWTRCSPSPTATW